MKNKKLPMEDYISFLELQIQAEKAMNKDFNRALRLLENVAKQLNAHYSDYDTLCAENRAMAEFLASLGYLQEQVSEIANGGKPKLIINEVKVKESCKLSAIGFFHADYPSNKSTDKLWEMAKKGKLQVCEAYEYFDTTSLVKEMQSLEKLILSEIKLAVSQLGGKNEKD